MSGAAPMGEIPAVRLEDSTAGVLALFSWQIQAFFLLLI